MLKESALFLHAPFLNGMTPGRLENEVLDDKADDDGSQQTGKNRWNIEESLCLSMTWLAR